MLPFPGHNHEADAETPLIAEGGSPEYPYEEAWGDTPETAADPGVVCDKELAEALGVPYSPTCYTGHSPADTWAREEAEADEDTTTLAHILFNVVGPLRMKLVTDGRFEVERGRTWEAREGGIFVTLSPN